MTQFRTLLTAAAVGLFANVAEAAPTLPSPAGGTPIEGEAVYNAFRGGEGIARIMDDFVPRIVADPRIGHRFKDTNLDRLKLMLTNQVCYLVGGPCTYDGRDMDDLQPTDVPQLDRRARPRSAPRTRHPVPQHTRTGAGRLGGPRPTLRRGSGGA